MRPELTVVVCVFNGVHVLPESLSRLLAQRSQPGLPLPTWELVVIDDGSVDGTLDLAREMLTGLAPAEPAALVATRLLSAHANFGIGAARAAAIVATRSGLLVFVDDDCAPEPDYLARLFGIWSEQGHDVVGVGGFIHSLHTDSFTRAYAQVRAPLAPLELGWDASASLAERIRRRLVPAASPRSARRPAAALVGASMSFRTDALASVGGFDSRMRFAGEEEDACARLRARFGPHCLLVDEALVMPHDFQPDIADALRRSRAYGRGAGRDFAARGGIPSLAPLPLGVAACLALGVLARRPLLGVALAAAGTAAYCRAEISHVRRDPRAAAFPAMTLAVESAQLSGFVSGLWANRARWRERRSSRAVT